MWFDAGSEGADLLVLFKLPVAVEPVGFGLLEDLVVDNEVIYTDRVTFIVVLDACSELLREKGTRRGHFERGGWDLEVSMRRLTLQGLYVSLAHWLLTAKMD